MNKKTFGILAVATVVAVGFAAAAIMSRPKIEALDQTGQLVFPKLVNDLDRLKSVVIKHGDQTVTLDWDGKAFHLRERGNVAADAEKARAMLVRLARMTKLEAKTRDPNRYDRLDLGDPAKKDGQAKQVTLIDSSGKEMANLVVGKRKFTLGGNEGGTYIRVIGDPQTWLALGDVSIGDAPRDWLKRQIVDIKDNSIKRVTVTRPNGEKIVVDRPKPGSPSLQIENIPKGLVPVSEVAAEDYGRLLSDFNMDDIAPATQIQFPKDKTTTAVVEGEDGFQVAIDMVQDGDKYWVRLKGTPAPDAKADAASTKAIAGLNEKADGWVFQVPNYQVTALTKTMADLAKKPDAKSSPAAAAPPPA